MFSPELRERVIAAFEEVGDRGTRYRYADRDGWWRDPELLDVLPAAIADEHAGARPSVVLAPQSSGYLLGGLVARALRVGFVGARKDTGTPSDSDAWFRTVAVPDYRDRHLELGFRRRLLHGGERVLIVDDWADTGSQLLALHHLVEQGEQRVVGTCVIVDDLADPRLRRDLRLSAIVRARALWS